MKAILKERHLILIPESAAEQAALAPWKEERSGHVFYVRPARGAGLALADLGDYAEACREPINVTSRATMPGVKLLSNFAPTPFELDGRDYACVEGFWQGLKFEDAADRRRLGALDGPAARRAGQERSYGLMVTYEERQVPVGTWEHWQLMERACAAKFTQHAAARAALLSTGERPLQHRTRRDSRTIPGVIMADIWMRLRHELRAEARAGGSSLPGATPAE